MDREPAEAVANLFDQLSGPFSCFKVIGLFCRDTKKRNRRSTDAPQLFMSRTDVY